MRFGIDIGSREVVGLLLEALQRKIDEVQTEMKADSERRLTITEIRLTMAMIGLSVGRYEQLSMVEKMLDAGEDPETCGLWIEVEGIYEPRMLRLPDMEVKVPDMPKVPRAPRPPQLPSPNISFVQLLCVLFPNGLPELTGRTDWGEVEEEEAGDNQDAQRSGADPSTNSGQDIPVGAECRGDTCVAREQGRGKPRPYSTGTIPCAADPHPYSTDRNVCATAPYSTDRNVCATMEPRKRKRRSARTYVRKEWRSRVRAVLSDRQMPVATRWRTLALQCQGPPDG